jgi:hypothetical protein
VVFVLGAVLLTPVCFVLLIMWQTNQSEAAVTDLVVCEAAAKPLARLCQSDPFLFRDEPVFAPAWTPPEVLKLHPTWVEIQPTGARVEFGGGFHHFGYALSRDTAADTPTRNGWKLEFYSEDASNRLLKAFTLDKSDHLEIREFIDQAMAEFRRRSLAGGGEQAVQERLALLLKFDEVEQARKSIHEFAAASALDWPDQLLALVIDDKVDPIASKRLDAWAGDKGDSSAWLLAAYVYGLAGDDEALERSVKSALTKPLDEPEWLSYNARYRGAVVCLQLFKSHRYATCAALCDTLLAGRPDSYLAVELNALRDTARRANPTNPPPPAPTIAEGELFDPFKGIDLRRLIITPGKAAESQPLPADPQVRMIHYLDQQIAAEPSSWRKWNEKFKYLRRIKRDDEVLAAFKAAAQAMPEWWKPRLALAMFGDETSRSQGRISFAAWVRGHPSFIHWCYLSRLYREAAQDAEALDALRQAVKYPLESVDSDETWVPHAFAFDAATFACKHKQYDLVLQITEIWSKPRGVYNYFDNDIYAFRAAAKLGQGQFAAAKADADKVVEIAKTRAIWAQNLDALQRAAAAKNSSFQYEPDPDKKFTTFSPFQD